ncbi:hypothetical protein C9422_03190 [Pseudomonas sp. B1(2018)]|nr:hypothetical protein C9422_03190 [Pseudomonas sp. B1(2018)]
MHIAPTSLVAPGLARVARTKPAFVARGLAPVGSRSGPNAHSGKPRSSGLRLLRSRTGASPLATGTRQS